MAWVPQSWLLSSLRMWKAATETRMWDVATALGSPSSEYSLLEQRYELVVAVARLAPDGMFDFVVADAEQARMVFYKTDKYDDIYLTPPSRR